MKWPRRAALALLTASLTLLTGCWNYQEAESLYIVNGIAVDRGMSGHKYHLTFEVLDLSGGGGQNTSMKSKLIETEGDTIAEAVKNATHVSDKSLYFSDCKLTVFSRDVARDGLTPVLDWFNRDPQPRFTVQLYISQEETAGELLQAQPSGGTVVSNQIASAMDGASAAGRCPMVHLYDADNALWGEGKDLVLPCLRKVTLKSVPQVEISGTAVFLGDKYVGTRTEEQAKTDMLLTAGISNGLLLVGKNPGEKDISLQIQQSSAKTQPVLSGALPAMKISITGECVYDEENAQQNYLTQMGLDQMEELADRSLERNAAEAVHSEQAELGCDIYGFGRKIYEQDPALWKKLKPGWHATFRSLQVEITAKLHIGNTGFAYPKGYE